jgi:hypothetical protein
MYIMFNVDLKGHYAMFGGFKGLPYTNYIPVTQIVES